MMSRPGLGVPSMFSTAPVAATAIAPRLAAWPKMLPSAMFFTGSRPKKPLNCSSSSCARIGEEAIDDHEEALTVPNGVGPGELVDDERDFDRIVVAVLCVDPGPADREVAGRVAGEIAVGVEDVDVVVVRRAAEGIVPLHERGEEVAVAGDHAVPADVGRQAGDAAEVVGVERESKSSPGRCPRSTCS